MRIINSLVTLVFLSSAVCSCSRIESSGATRPTTGGNTDFAVSNVGEPLAAWTEGTLDIHFINTGRGESAFYIFPDGTTMLVDMAGSLFTQSDVEEGESGPTDPRPNAETPCADVIVNYINHFTSAKSKGHLDYAVLTHFHEDHMGNFVSTLPTGGDGSFRMNTLNEIGVRVPYRHYLDRNYPDYNYPTILTGDKYTNLKSFLKWTAAANGTQEAAFDPGATNQIALQYDAASYPSFKIQNLSAGGRYWTGVGQTSTSAMPAAFTTEQPAPNENCFSCAFWLQFGKFDFYAGGDHQYSGRSTYSYYDSEAPMVKVMGGIDVAKANHHGTANANSPELMKVYQPAVWIANVWRDVQPNPKTINNVIGANPNVDIYMTNLCAVNVPNFTETQKARFVSTQGHIVIRVNKTGTTYYVYVLDDSDMNYKVTKISKYSSK